MWAGAGKWGSGGPLALVPAEKDFGAVGWFLPFMAYDKAGHITPSTLYWLLNSYLPVSFPLLPRLSTLLTPLSP